MHVERCWFGGTHKTGAKTDNIYAKEYAIKELFPYCSEDGKSTRLHEACKNGDLKKVRRICRNKHVSLREVQTRDLNGHTAMYYAINSNSTQIVKLLFEKFPRLFNTEGYIQEQVYNSIMLQVAIENMNLEIMELLLQGGCPVDIKTRANAFWNDLTPLQFACFFYCKEKHTKSTSKEHPVLQIVKKLLEYKSDPNIVDNQMRTALHIVLAKQCQTDLHDDVACLLLDHGFDLDSRDHEGRSALDLAVQYGRVNVVRKLVEQHHLSISKVSV